MELIRYVVVLLVVTAFTQILSTEAQAQFWKGANESIYNINNGLNDLYRDREKARNANLRELEYILKRMRSKYASLSKEQAKLETKYDEQSNLLQTTEEDLRKLRELQTERESEFEEIIAANAEHWADDSKTKREKKRKRNLKTFKTIRIVIGKRKRIHQLTACIWLWLASYLSKPPPKLQ